MKGWRPNEVGATARNREERSRKAGKEGAGEARLTGQVRNARERDARGPGKLGGGAGARGPAGGAQGPG